MSEWIGYMGVLAFAVAWIPQSWETLRAGRCEVNLWFLLFAALGSFFLMIYAILRNDLVFSVLNALTTLGALLNVTCKLFPRSRV